MRITVSHDLSRIAQSLSRLSGKLTGSLEEPLRAIGGILESSTRRRIAEPKLRPTANAGRTYLPLRQKPKNGRGGILVDHGNLVGKHYARGIGKKRDYRLNHGLLGLCAGRHEKHAGASVFGLVFARLSGHRRIDVRLAGRIDCLIWL